MNAQTEFGNTLRRIRTEKNLFRKQLAELLGISQDTIIGWEQGKFFPRKTGLVIKLAKVLDVHSDELLIPL